MDAGEVEEEGDPLLAAAADCGRMDHARRSAKGWDLSVLPSAQGAQGIEREGPHFCSLSDLYQVYFNLSAYTNPSSICPLSGMLGLHAPFCADHKRQPTRRPN